MQQKLTGRVVDRSIERLWVGGLTLGAMVLLTLNLGNVPLKDWDEGLVAQVAKEIWQSPSANTWLHPTLWGEPYLNKPPLMHWLIAGLYAIAGVNEWTARLPGALLTMLSVPLFYGIGRQVFHTRLPTLFATVVYLTSLPVIRNGRFAMLDGAILCFLLLLVWCVLRARQNYQYLLGVGLSLGLICLTKGILVSVLLGGIALGFLAWDTPRLFRQPHLWLGLLLGSLPAAGWYVAQWMHYGSGFWNQNLVEQSLQRIWTEVESNGAPPWYYLVELVKYGAPWILFLPASCRYAWDNRSLSWAKLVILWAGLYGLVISIMATKLPWYILPLFPALALMVGAELAELWQQGRRVGVRQVLPVIQAGGMDWGYGRGWVVILSVLALLGGSGAAYFLGWHSPADFQLVVLLAVVSGTMGVAARLAAQHNPQFIAVLSWGTFLALLLLICSPHWAWELAEAYPVRPVAELIQSHVPASQKLYTSYPYHRPSLNFYSQRPVLPASEKQLRRLWRRQPGTYLLLDRPTLVTLNIPSEKIVAQTGTQTGTQSNEWFLVANHQR